MLISKDNLIWIDLEMTGLEPDQDTIIEIATIVTDKFLEEIEIGPTFVIHHNSDQMQAMDRWNREHHSRSGLIQDAISSLIDVKAAEAATIQFLSKFCYQGASPMCGNSICQDRRFLARHMPDLERFFHYRNLDVSTLKMLVNHWMPNSVLKREKKASLHRALEDIKDSIKELKYYQNVVFKLNYIPDDLD